ncbi:hypothetical protein GGI25_004481 [Coemansia spiralis]|uniref:Uncharacterized protein n=2 Tax=Coemansia TaxID=4863 RepID=A0A9W8G0B2_9FUNG|nr:hypothetical protein BX070DRAFT_236904 [Coemansia spiralis]KAJ1988524.1 hypothetical protein EDC05_005243 [Coemansia umbellata]KAJ2619835.1 hypothetical protein GGI26_005509 [Coemansia sp. RSA 1358]KAJ2673996.1 hypothetical protein GGI25_004481 [Coemansia spiralis]
MADDNTDNSACNCGHQHHDEAPPSGEEQMRQYLEREKQEKETRKRLTAEWSERLVGKKHIVLEGSDEEKQSMLAAHEQNNTFSDESLRKPFRILHGEQAVMTMDYRPDRLNVRLGDDGVCTEVFFV